MTSNNQTDIKIYRIGNLSILQLMAVIGAGGLILTEILKHFLL